jgi:CubicO group peptidase (beta-lactamase class C family)
MQGVTKYFKPGEIEVKALQAGVDILLMPENVQIAFDEIKKALNDGRLSENEINEKCKKILKTKKWLGLDRYKPVDLNHLYTDLNSPEAENLKLKLIEASLTLIKNTDKTIPFKNLDTQNFASVSIGSGAVNEFQKTLELYDDISIFSISKNAEEKDFNILLNKLSNFSRVIISVHQMNNTAPDFGMTPNTLNFIKRLSDKNKVILVLFGNAYALHKIADPSKINAVLVAYNDWKETREYAAQLLFGGIAARGKLPVSIGDTFKVGKGEFFVQNRLNYSNAYALDLHQDTLLKIDSVILDAIQNKATPGATVMAIRNNTVFFLKSYGNQSYNNSPKTINSNLYDLASLTKITSTLPILMQLYDQNKIQLNDKLSSYISELKGTDKEDITIKEVLAHNSGLIAWIPFYKDTYKDQKNNILNPDIYAKTKSEKYSVKVADNMYMDQSYIDTIYKKIIDSKLLSEKKYKYSDLGFILLHKIIENLTSETQEKYSRQYFYAKLGANTTGYLPLERFNKNEILPSENDTYYRKQIVRGYVHDYAAAMTGGVNGHAGLFSNANDLAKVLQMYLNGGTYGGERYIKEKTLKLFTSCVYCNDSNRRAYGFDKPLRPTGGPCSQSASDESYGHSGFTGVLVWIDPKYDFIYIFLSNRTYPDSNNNKLLKMDVRTKVQDLFYKSFPDLDTAKVVLHKVKGSL